MNPAPQPKIGSMADYIVRPDLASLLAEAHADYHDVAAGAPRLLAQQDIAARFRGSRRPARPAPPPHEPR